MLCDKGEAVPNMWTMTGEMYEGVKGPEGGYLPVCYRNPVGWGCPMAGRKGCSTRCVRGLFGAREG